MPFVALREDTRERIYIGDYQDPRQALSGVELVCSDCHMPMQIKQGTVICHHFAHKPGDRLPCYWRDHSGAESHSHLLAKRAVIEYLNHEPRPFGQCTIEVEYPITTPNGKRRYIDVFVATQDGDRFAHEIQLSKQSLEEFQERTADYRAVDIETVWWLSGETATNENKVWCERNCYYFGEVSIGTFSRRVATAKFNSDGKVIEREESWY